MGSGVKNSANHAPNRQGNIAKEWLNLLVQFLRCPQKVRL